MPEVTVSPKYQIVIPKDVREMLKIKPGQKLQVVVMKGTIRLLTPRTLADLRGLVKGLRWNHEEDRDHTDRY